MASNQQAPCGVYHVLGLASAWQVAYKVCTDPTWKPLSFTLADNLLQWHHEHHVQRHLLQGMRHAEFSRQQGGGTRKGKKNETVASGEGRSSGVTDDDDDDDRDCLGFSLKGEKRKNGGGSGKKKQQSSNNSNSKLASTTTTMRAVLRDNTAELGIIHDHTATHLFRYLVQLNMLFAGKSGDDWRIPMRSRSMEQNLDIEVQEARDAALGSAELQSRVKKLWLSLPKDHRGYLTQHIHNVLFTKFFEVFAMDVYDDVTRRQLLEKDWQLRSEGRPAVDYDQFEQSMIATVDAWTETRDLEECLQFIDATQVLFRKALKEHHRQEKQQQREEDDKISTSNNHDTTNMSSIVSGGRRRKMSGGDSNFLAFDHKRSQDTATQIIRCSLAKKNVIVKQEEEDDDDLELSSRDDSGSDDRDDDDSSMGGGGFFDHPTSQHDDHDHREQEEAENFSIFSTVVGGGAVVPKNGLHPSGQQQQSKGPAVSPFSYDHKSDGQFATKSLVSFVNSLRKHQVSHFEPRESKHGALPPPLEGGGRLPEKVMDPFQVKKNLAKEELKRQKKLFSSRHQEHQEDDDDENNDGETEFRITLHPHDHKEGVESEEVDPFAGTTRSAQSAFGNFGPDTSAGTFGSGASTTTSSQPRKSGSFVMKSTTRQQQQHHPSTGMMMFGGSSSASNTPGGTITTAGGVGLSDVIVRRRSSVAIPLHLPSCSSSSDIGLEGAATTTLNTAKSSSVATTGQKNLTDTFAEGGALAVRTLRPSPAELARAEEEAFFLYRPLEDLHVPAMLAEVLTPPEDDSLAAYSAVDRVAYSFSASDNTAPRCFGTANAITLQKLRGFASPFLFRTPAADVGMVWLVENSTIESSYERWEPLSSASSSELTRNWMHGEKHIDAWEIEDDKDKEILGRHAPGKSVWLHKLSSMHVFPSSQPQLVLNLCARLDYHWEYHNHTKSMWFAFPAKVQHQLNEWLAAGKKMCEGVVVLSENDGKNDPQYEATNLEGRIPSFSFEGQLDGVHHFNQFEVSLYDGPMTVTGWRQGITQVLEIRYQTLFLDREHCIEPLSVLDPWLPPHLASFGLQVPTHALPPQKSPHNFNESVLVQEDGSIRLVASKNSKTVRTVSTQPQQLDASLLGGSLTSPHQRPLEETMEPSNRECFHEQIISPVAAVQSAISRLPANIRHIAESSIRKGSVITSPHAQSLLFSHTDHDDSDDDEKDSDGRNSLCSESSGGGDEDLDGRTYRHHRTRKSRTSKKRNTGITLITRTVVTPQHNALSPGGAGDARNLLTHPSALTTATTPLDRLKSGTIPFAQCRDSGKYIPPAASVATSPPHLRKSQQDDGGDDDGIKGEERERRGDTSSTTTPPVVLDDRRLHPESLYGHVFNRWAKESQSIVEGTHRLVDNPLRRRRLNEDEDPKLLPPPRPMEDPLLKGWHIDSSKRGHVGGGMGTTIAQSSGPAALIRIRRGVSECMNLTMSNATLLLDDEEEKSKLKEQQNGDGDLSPIRSHQHQSSAASGASSMMTSSNKNSISAGGGHVSVSAARTRRLKSLKAVQQQSSTHSNKSLPSGFPNDDRNNKSKSRLQGSPSSSSPPPRASSQVSLSTSSSSKDVRSKLFSVMSSTTASSAALLRPSSSSFSISDDSSSRRFLSSSSRLTTRRRHLGPQHNSMTSSGGGGAEGFMQAVRASTPMENVKLLSMKSSEVL